MEIEYFETFKKDNKEVYDLGMKKVKIVMDNKELTPVTKFKQIFEIIKVHSENIMGVKTDGWFEKWMDDIYTEMVRTGKMTLTEVMAERYSENKKFKLRKRN